MMYYLLYVGKSNKNFTYNNVYNFMGSPSFLSNEEKNRNYMNVTIYGNNGRLVNFYIQHLQYFNKNFKLIDDKQLQQLERKNKLIFLGKTK